MRVLYAVFVLSIAALLWAAYAIVRTVRGHRISELRGEIPPEPESQSREDEQ